MHNPLSPLSSLSGQRKLVLLLSLLLMIAIWAAPIRPGIVLGESMAPSFRDGQIFLMSRLRNHASLRRGDVVVLALDGETYIKRVWALAGDAVRGMDWQEVAGHPDQLVSGTQEFARLRDLARRAPRVGRAVELTVPPGHAFVVGDAAEGSYDSRHFGPVPLTAVKGRVVVPSLLASFRGNANAHGVRAATRSPGLDPAPAAPRRRP